MKPNKLKEILDLNQELTFSHDVATIRGFLNDFDYNENHEDKRTISSYHAHQACDRIQDLLKKSLFCIGDFIPPIKNTGDEFIYSVRTPEKPPFIARTNDPEVIKHIYELFIEIGSWQEAKFLLENLRLNIEKRGI